MFLSQSFSSLVDYTIRHPTGGSEWGESRGKFTKENGTFGYFVGIKPNECSQKRRILNSKVSIKPVYIA